MLSWSMTVCEVEVRRLWCDGVIVCDTDVGWSSADDRGELLYPDHKGRPWAKVAAPGFYDDGV